MRIIVTGLVAQHSLGGVAWDYLQYVEGFRQLGHDVYYLEDTEVWPYDPINETVTANCSHNINHLRAIMDKLGLTDRWIYRNAADASYHGLTEAETKELCAATDLFVNVSGSCWLRPEYRAIPRKLFIDTDPLFTQFALLSARAEVVERVHAHDVHFTYAENVGTASCLLPTAGLRWLPTRQPIVLDWWPVADEPPRDVFTTVMSWVSYQSIEYADETWGQKDVEFMKFIELPRRSAQRFEIAMGRGQGKTRPTELLRQHGWTIVEPDAVLPDPWTYRDYLRRSKAEWSIAKEGYVKSRSGWFSGRSACYLAAGRPCVLQDTGWSAHYPTGRGLLAFQTLDEAVAGIENIAGNYSAHCRAARQTAEQNFDARRVLPAMLGHIGL